MSKKEQAAKRKVLDNLADSKLKKESLAKSKGGGISTNMDTFGMFYDGNPTSMGS